AASQGVIRASIADQSDHTSNFPGPAMSAGRTIKASLRATGTSAGLAATSAAWPQPVLIASTSGLSATPSSPSTSRVRFWICAPRLVMRPVCPAPAKRYWPRSTPSTCCASRRANFFGDAPAPNKRNVATSWAFASSALRPPLARFTSSMASRRSTRARVRLNSGSVRSFIVVIVTIKVIVRGAADRQHLAHRRVGKLVVETGGDPFRLRDPGDGPVGEFGQPAANGDAVLGCQGSSATHEGQVDHHAPPVDVLEAPVFTPFRKAQGSRLAIDIAHRLDVPARISKKELP